LIGNNVIAQSGQKERLQRQNKGGAVAFFHLYVNKCFNEGDDNQKRVNGKADKHRAIVVCPFNEQQKHAEHGNGENERHFGEVQNANALKQIMHQCSHAERQNEDRRSVPKSGGEKRERDN